MSGDDFKMTWVGEADLPTTSGSDGVEESAKDVGVDASQAKDFSSGKQVKG